MSRDTPRNALLLQMLSVYLLLLAFFVVLNSISHVEAARTRAVSGSLNETFSVDGRPDERTVLFTSDAGSAPRDAAMLTRIGDLIRTELELVEARDVEPGRSMEITLPADVLFVPGRASIDPLRRPLIERIARSLADPLPGMRYDADIIVGTDGSARLSTRRAAYLASIFTVAGAPPRSVSAGTDRESPGSLKLVFHVRPLAEGRFTFGESSAR
jgi:flagellar motor protein MotB